MVMITRVRKRKIDERAYMIYPVTGYVFWEKRVLGASVNTFFADMDDVALLVWDIVLLRGGFGLLCRRHCQTLDTMKVGQSERVRCAESKGREGERGDC